MQAPNFNYNFFKQNKEMFFAGILIPRYIKMNIEHSLIKYTPIEYI